MNFAYVLLYAALLVSGILIGAGVSGLAIGDSVDAFQSSEQCSGFGDGENVAFQGKSMLPTLQPGDVTLNRKFNSEKNLSVGDVVSAWNQEEGLLIAHRVIEVDAAAKTFRMQGDNNPVPDEYEYQFSDIRGIVCGVLYR